MWNPGGVANEASTTGMGRAETARASANRADGWPANSELPALETICRNKEEIPEAGACARICDTSNLVIRPVAHHLLLTPGMNAAVQIGTGTEGSGGAAIARPTAQPAGEAAGSAAPNLNASMRANWRDVLEALELDTAGEGKPANSPEQLSGRVLPL